MKFDRTGMILYVIKYKECVEFYENILELEKIFFTSRLACFEFGGSYLMIKICNNNGVDSNQKKFCLRMNIPDIDFMIKNLRSKKIKANYYIGTRGATVRTLDPDGNRIEFRNSKAFEKYLNAKRTSK